MTTEAIARMVPRRHNAAYHSELHNTYKMTMTATHAAPQIAPPTAPAAIDDDTGMLRIGASCTEPMANRR